MKRRSFLKGLLAAVFAPRVNVSRETIEELKPDEGQPILEFDFFPSLATTNAMPAELWEKYKNRELTDLEREVNERARKTPSSPPPFAEESPMLADDWKYECAAFSCEELARYERATREGEELPVPKPTWWLLLADGWKYKRDDLSQELPVWKYVVQRVAPGEREAIGIGEPVMPPLPWHVTWEFELPKESESDDIGGYLVPPQIAKALVNKFEKATGQKLITRGTQED